LSQFCAFDDAHVDSATIVASINQCFGGHWPLLVLIQFDPVAQISYPLLSFVTICCQKLKSRAAMSELVEKKNPSFKEVMQKASASALRGGAAGAAAMGANVACLMVRQVVMSLSERLAPFIMI
jgi:hypothetical protein